MMDWDTLTQTTLHCTACKLCEGRKNVVFGVGVPTAEVMFIGEGPGQHEDEQGEPFVGRSGQLMDKMMNYIGLDRSRNVYIANIVKCRPPKNRDPLPEEKDACWPWLREQTEIVDPKIIICLGRISATALISEDFRITRQHGQWFDIGGRRYMAIYHPSALLRDVDKRPETFDDLLSLREKIREIQARI